ncbi:MAG: hypothetical protein HYT37_04085 [Candidatus Sungbacteria bacterium]|nr:hypothetical protein [Candidatus Sungbacteria bacterium]
MSQESFEYKRELESEMEELRTLKDRRDLLQQHWSELFEKSEAIESKYPWQERFDEAKRYKGDRSFLNPEDKEDFLTIKEGMGGVEAERDELDKEILKKRFELGLKYLAEINQKEDVVWQEVREHNPDPQNHFDILYSKQWRAKMGDNIAEVSMTGETGSSFFSEMKRFVEEVGDTQVLEALKKWPKERRLDFNEVRLSFSISPKSASKREREALVPGLGVSKRFDHYDETRDSVEVNLPLSHAAYAFPKIEEDQQELAKTEMINLTKRLGVKYF